MGKQKLWRREAAIHNEAAGERHQGRKNKVVFFQGPAWLAMNPTLARMMRTAGQYIPKEE